MRYLAATTAAALLVLGMSNSQANAYGRHDTELVDSWYHRYLGRCPDPCGLNTWVGQLGCGIAPLAVEAGILSSDEYYCRHGHTPVGFVAGLYADVLGRGACAWEVQSWVCRLERCGNRQTLALDFLNAAQAELAQQALQSERPVYAPDPVALAAAVAHTVEPPYLLRPAHRGVHIQFGFGAH